MVADLQGARPLTSTRCGTASGSCRLPVTTEMTALHGPLSDAAPVQLRPPRAPVRADDLLAQASGCGSTFQRRPYGSTIPSAGCRGASVERGKERGEWGPGCWDERTVEIRGSDGSVIVLRPNGERYDKPQGESPRQFGATQASGGTVQSDTRGTLLSAQSWMLSDTLHHPDEVTLQPADPAGKVECEGAECQGAGRVLPASDDLGDILNAINVSRAKTACGWTRQVLLMALAEESQDTSKRVACSAPSQEEDDIGARMRRLPASQRALLLRMLADAEEAAGGASSGSSA